MEILRTAENDANRLTERKASRRLRVSSTGEAAPPKVPAAVDELDFLWSHDLHQAFKAPTTVVGIHRLQRAT